MAKCAMLAGDFRNLWGLEVSIDFEKDGSYLPGAGEKFAGLGSVGETACGIGA
jgi:hypothetical protein